ncbi:hypothetical protein SYNPS1DRAFT_19824 [Syncephalis pseudoplumigaleata]|uniref:GPI ethanolamine phosphate transferase 2 C-terminal domain-containing protein n=1 Tax=Syncephalis pseudoplumigaleata TaxID=1712513 RepID=A0A4P9YRW8_9FUNG|nr:hypothetical protein SYNPS1DRAFT_19824 [Syncephalis pseudoplumigaleata]|eukprot:RKP22636.1 hypothetical protein SYNPS1DRAFT_19824 [Syncephalis pseudoplumigaleata]
MRAWLPSFDDGFGWLALFAAQSTMFASNSLVVFEDRIDLALLQTYGCVSIIRAIARYRVCCARSDNPPLAAVWRRWMMAAGAFLLLTRVSGSTTICREEQGSSCVPNFYTGLGASASDATLIQLVAAAIIVPWLLRRVFIGTQSFHGVARLWTDWGLRIALLLSASYWIIEESDDGMLGMLKRALAQFAFGLSLLVGLIGWRSNPLCLAVGQVETSPATSPSIRAILGIDNAYGAPYLVWVTMIYAALAQTQQPSGGLSFAMAMCHLVAAIELFDAQAEVQRRTQQSRRTTSSIFGQAVVLGLMAQHYYFATGHQATLASIQWRVGFIGLREMSWVVSPLLMVANTFASHILFSAAIPLVVLWRLSGRRPAPATTSQQQQPASIWTGVRRIVFAWSLVWTVLAASICIWCMYFRRHLMVWKVWAPRFMLGTVSALLSQLILLLATLLFGVARTVGAVNSALGRPLDDEEDDSKPLLRDHSSLARI